MKMKKAIYLATVAVLVVVFGVSAFFVGRYIVDSRKSSAQTEEMAQLIANAQSTAAPTQPVTTTPATTVPTTVATEPTTVPTEPVMLPGYAEAYEQNNDLVGWITIEGTKLNNPVFQTPDEKDFYLQKGTDKKFSTHGSIYAWEKGDVNTPSDNITLFGHNMADGSMFACLHSYVNQKTWENNPLIFFNTLYEEHTYKIFAVFRTSGYDDVGFPYHQFVDAGSQAEFDEFISDIKEMSIYDTGITPKYGDKIICLSTCEYTIDNGRLVVAAVRWT